VVDVGHCIELYSEFSCTGGIYRPFPDSISYRNVQIWERDFWMTWGLHFFLKSLKSQL
jgi:hypothetical protein